MPTDPSDLEWAKRRAEEIWAKVTAPLYIQSHAHSFARTSHGLYERECDREAPNGLSNAIHRAIEDIRAREAASFGVPEAQPADLQTAKDARERALAALDRGATLANSEEAEDFNRQMAINQARDRILAEQQKNKSSQK